MPVNGIYESKTRIVFTHDTQKNRIVSDLVILATRKEGRNLLYEVCDGEKYLFLELDRSSTNASHSVDSVVSFIRYSPNTDSFVVKSAMKGREGYKIPTPSFLTLAHALIHYIHSENEEQYNIDMKKTA